MYRLLLTLVLALLSGCATGPAIDRTYTAVSQDSRVQFLILHYTVGDFPSALNELMGRRASSHYLVNDNPPVIYQLVDENRRAYHAGVSSWSGQGSLNAASIGIEIVNPGYRETPQGRIYFEYPREQIDAVLALVKKIVAEHAIRPDRVLGHSDIAPQRKVDPGPLFPWKRFADEGLILWPRPELVSLATPQYEQQLPGIDWFQQMLSRFGYAVPLNGQLDEATVNVIAAFQMKYRPARFDGMPDAETAAMLEVLTAPSGTMSDKVARLPGLPGR
ncbi:MAG: N-acetylmuramoyl-L-alanine amidase [Betaproteobacteria bacterium]